MAAVTADVSATAPTHWSCAWQRQHRGTLRVEVDGVDVTGTLVVPNTGGWQAWQTIARMASLCRLDVAASAWSSWGGTNGITNVNFLRFLQLALRDALGFVWSLKPCQTHARR